jgi:hypothetical protein
MTIMCDIERLRRESDLKLKHYIFSHSVKSGGDSPTDHHSWSSWTFWATLVW